jgi:hypothetical protein
LPTDRQKLGAIIGDSSRTACNVVLNPGALVPRHSFVRATSAAVFSAGPRNPQSD